MKKNEYKDLPSIAYYSGLNGLELKHIEYGITDYLIVQAGSWTSKKTMHRVKIQYDKNGDSFIKLWGYKIPLNEFIKCRQ